VRRCSICICTYEEDEDTTFLPCKHRFHSACVLEWFKRSHVCPYCKDDVAFSLARVDAGVDEAPSGTIKTDVAHAM